MSRLKHLLVRAVVAAAVVTVIPACGGGGGGGGGGGKGVGVSGKNSTLTGGTGTAANGGSGGVFVAQCFSGGELRMLRSGRVNSRIIAKVKQPDLGTNPVVISANTTWDPDVAADPIDPATLVLSNTGGTVTGIHIERGATLTIKPNFDTAGSATTRESVQFTLPNALFIEGTLRTGRQDLTALGDGLSDNGGHLGIASAGPPFFFNAVITSTGAVDTSGVADGADSDTVGGNGGNFTITGADVATIINAGTITSVGGSGQTGGSGGVVGFISAFYSVYNMGDITTNGAAGTGTSGGFAGVAVGINSVAAAAGGTTVYTLDAAAPGWMTVGDLVTVASCGAGANNGTFTVTAVAGTSMTLDNAAGVVEAADSPGTVTLAAAFGSGGNGGTVIMAGSGAVPTTFPGGGMFNTGEINASGASGGRNGGAAGAVQLIAGGPGAVTNSADITVNGGNATDAASNGVGGPAGTLVFLANNGSIRLTGRYTARGGNGAGTGNGGAGPTIVAVVEDAVPVVAGEPVIGGMAFGAEVLASGGNGATGAPAGVLVILVNQDTSQNYRPTDHLEIVGWRSFDQSGGDGAVDGGGGGIFLASQELSSALPFTVTLGGIENQVNITSRGGNGTAGDGGTGGLVGISVNDPGQGILTPGRSLINKGIIDISGGDGNLLAGGGGNAGALGFYDRYKVENSGAITANGGFGGVGSGGNGGQIDISSDDVVINKAALTANGNDGDEDGGLAGVIGLIGRTTSSRGNHTADGGNGGGGAGDVGGAGGFIEILSTETASNVTGTFAVRAGTGLVAGTVGIVVVDGLTLALIGGVVTY